MLVLLFSPLKNQELLSMEMGLEWSRKHDASILQPYLLHHSIKGLQGDMLLFRSEALGRRMVQLGKIDVLDFRIIRNHRSNSPCRQEDLRHAVAREASNNELSLFAWHIADIRKAIVGISHDLSQ